MNHPPRPPARPDRRIIKLAAAIIPAVLLAAGCSGRLPDDFPKTASTALSQPVSTGIAGLFAREAAKHPGQSGFAMLADNRTAFTDRAALVDFATETLDIQYYIWTRDTIGNTLGERIIRAADRGVRVRFLLDDINFKKRDSIAASIAAHPNIELRVFNPAVHRSARTLEVLGNFRRLNKRMHNKIMVMDNSCAIVGGRNIADEYFGLNPAFNMRDLDLFATGPVVRDISNTFDEFWNSRAAVPIEAIVKEPTDINDFHRQHAALQKLVRSSELPFPLEADLKSLRSRLTDTVPNLIWADAEVLHDSIKSMKGDGTAETVVDRLRHQILGAKRELHIESAYFVLEDRGLQSAAELASRGVKLRILTNSLASNDVVAAQAGHRQNITTLLKSGAQLHEFRPDARAVRSQVAPVAQNAHTSLHTKALVIDDERTFIGSYNLDPRSAEINSEIGILIHSKPFARIVGKHLSQGVEPENAYHLTLDKRGRPQWQTTINGRTKTWSRDPETSALRRITASALSALPIDSQL